MIIQGMDIVMIIMLMLGEVIRGQISVANLGLWLLKRFKCLKSILFSLTNWEFMGRGRLILLVVRLWLKYFAVKYSCP